MSRLHLDIHRDDTVQVMSGKDRGKRGVVVRTVPASGKIVVKGVNVLKRHRKANQEKGGTKVIQGGIVDFELSLSYPKGDARLQKGRKADPHPQDGPAEREEGDRLRELR